MPSSRKANSLPGRSGRFCCSARRKAQRTANIGLANSEGCSDIPAMFSQRREPFTSGPTNSVRMSSTTQVAKPTSATRRICRGVRKDMPRRTRTAGIANTAWRFTK